MPSDDGRALDHVERRRVVGAAFSERFGRQPSHWVRAPGRVDAMGSHTDYNEGFVLSLSIDRDTWIAAAPRSDDRVRVESSNLPGRCEFDLGDVMAGSGATWSIYFQAVAQLLASEGYALTACDALVHGTLPIASGLGSSASLESATAVLFRELGGWQIEPVALAKLCQRAENEIVGVNCGILDQYSSILGEAGRALLLDCRQLTHRTKRVPDDLTPVICNTGARRELSGSEYGARRASCEAGARELSARLPGVRALRDVEIADYAMHEAALDAVDARRCRFVIEENARVGGLADALERGDRAAIARICAASFAGARDLFEISIPEMECMYAAMTAAPGVVGARQAGAGFGGCMLAFVESDRVDAFAGVTANAYQRATGNRPDVDPVRTAAGAGPLGD